MILDAAILFTAFVLDLLLGDPPFLFHPVRLIGATISAFEKLLLRLRWSGSGGGILLVTMTIGLAIGVYLALRHFIGGLHPFLTTVLDLYLAYSCLALKDLCKHAEPIAETLTRSNLTQARTELQKIVGRDTSNLNPEGVARGAVESVAENFVDGVLSPIFWYTLIAVFSHVFGCPAPAAAGIVGMLGFKAISTLDSMVGYRSDHYLLFGRPAARLDDLANFLPARLSLIILSIGAVLSGEKAWAGWKISRRDRLKHLSPNAGHSESFVAGALGIKLGGPTVYQKNTVDKPWLGDGDEEVGPQHIRRCCRLIYRSAWFACFVSVAALLGFGALFR
ncbi:MAG: adenosylcobinamide-phosphate synthase CbiB [Syntrophobacteria bacterium]